MAKQNVTLYLDDAGIRVLVTQGKLITSFAESQLETGAVENNVIIKPDYVASAIKNLLNSLSVKASKVNVGISGTRCLTRPITLPKLPKEMLEEAVTREAQRLLPIPLDELYLSWQTVQGETKQTQTFVVAIPKKSVDALIGTLRKAGLKAAFMEIKPLLLTRAVKEPTAILLDVQATEFDIVVIVDSVPHPVRTIRFALEGLSEEQKLASIRNELNRTIAFYEATNPAIDDSVPVFVSGELAGSEASQQLSEEIGHPVLPLEAPFDVPAGLDARRYLSNMCLALPWQPQGQKTTSVASGLNMIPEAYQIKTISLTNIIGIPIGVGAVGLLALMVLFGRNASAEVGTVSEQVAVATRALEQKQLANRDITNEVADLQTKVSEAKTLRTSLTVVLDMLQTQTQAAGNDLALALNMGRQNLTLTSLHHVGNVLTLMGRATQEKNVLAYIEELDGTGQFGNIKVTDMTRNAKGEIEFSVVGTLQEKGLGVNATEVALGSLPNSVVLTSVNSGKDCLNVEGTAPNEDRITAYLRALEASGAFKFVTVTRMTRTSGDSMTFSLALKTGE